VTNKVNEILKTYDTLTEDEKISLFCSLSTRGMREHYDVSYERYRVKVKNLEGLFIMNKFEIGYNEREVRRVILEQLNDKGYHKYEERYSHSELLYGDKHRRICYENIEIELENK